MHDYLMFAIGFLAQAFFPPAFYSNGFCRKEPNKWFHLPFIGF